MPVEPSTPHKKARGPRPTIIAEKSTRARHSPCQTPIPRLDPRLGKRMSGSNLDVSAQPAKLRTESACNFKATIYLWQKKSNHGNPYLTGARIAAGAPLNHSQPCATILLSLSAAMSAPLCAKQHSSRSHRRIDHRVREKMLSPATRTSARNTRRNRFVA
jgi:hypothetical protein